MSFSSVVGSSAYSQAVQEQWGFHGGDWSSMSGMWNSNLHQGANALQLVFRQDDIYSTSAPINRHGGHPIRCLAYQFIQYSPPLSFVRSGYFFLTYGSLSHAGSNGYSYTSSVSTSSSSFTGARFLDIRTVSLLSSAGPSDRWNGFPLRCPVKHKFDYFNHASA